ncbi:MAG: phosphoribosylformylglycinamidine synthase subunit PurS [Phycisphaeraceae bacterium]|nr:phosphoribosylformylglycinamidine synthase subunit PurS [Phycisphaeraceae bacterium]
MNDGRDGSTLSPRVLRFEVATAPGRVDPRGDAVLAQARALGVGVESVRTARVYLIEPSSDGTHESLAGISSRLLADPVVETAREGISPTPSGAVTIEVHPQPGVMDPAAQSVAEAIADLTGSAAHVTTGWRYDFRGINASEAASFARRALANPVIHEIRERPFHPDALPTGHAYALKITHVPIRDLDDGALASLSRTAHLFLSLDEMRAIQSEYRRVGRDPSDIELETLAQTWSEHCVHKTLKSRIRYESTGAATDAIRWSGRPGHTVNADGTVTIENLLKSTVAAATFELIDEGIDWTLSVFKDNSGVIALDDTWAVCIKVETHNHPSAIEPYGGSATGVGGCIRDVIGTGLGAKPIANSDVFCVAYPDRWTDGDPRPGKERLPKGTLHPRRILGDVVAGVRDYGNRMGIPTISGAVAFDDRYIGNPLVFCGCVGLLPRNRVKGAARAGDLIVALGGRTGRDGIHGATFSSAELTDSHADEFGHAVQIGNAIEEKRTLDAILRARDEHGEPLYHGLTDCGAGGFSSAVGEMGATLGAAVDLDRAPLKYDGLSYTEIWISEAQERMVLAVPAANLDALRRICDEEGVELSVLGTFGTPGEELVLRYMGTEVGRLSMHFLHEGIPTPVRDASWSPSPAKGCVATPRPSTRDALLALLAHPDIASKHWIIRQYDHEVQGNTILKPLVGPGGIGPGDGSVIEPIPGSGRGIAIACGLQTPVGDPEIGGDPYQMALAAIDECVRNLVCVGVDPGRVAILDNFCWPSCQKPENLGSLVRAAEGCYDGAKAYGTPFVSGKDSLNNQFTTEDGRTVQIPPTLLITGMGIVPDMSCVCTSDAKRAGSEVVLIEPRASTHGLGASRYASMFGVGASDGEAEIPSVDLVSGPETARLVAAMVRERLVRSAHDVSDGGLLVALSEMLIGTQGGDAPLGLRIEAAHDALHGFAFSEAPSRYVIEVEPRHLARIDEMASKAGARVVRIGTLDDSGSITWPAAGLDVRVEELARAWRGTLDW